MKKRIAALITVALLLVCMMPLSSLADGTRYPTPDGYNDNDYQKLVLKLGGKQQYRGRSCRHSRRRFHRCKS